MNNFTKTAKLLGEGTWAVPDTDKKKAELKKLLASPLPAKKAADALYHLIGDDELFDDIGELKDKNPDADARSVVKAFLKKHKMLESGEYFVGVELIESSNLYRDFLKGKISWAQYMQQSGRQAKMDAEKLAKEVDKAHGDAIDMNRKFDAKKRADAQREREKKLYMSDAEFEKMMRGARADIVSDFKHDQSIGGYDDEMSGDDYMQQVASDLAWSMLNGPERQRLALYLKKKDISPAYWREYIADYLA